MGTCSVRICSNKLIFYKVSTRISCHGYTYERNVSFSSFLPRNTQELNDRSVNEIYRKKLHERKYANDLWLNRNRRDSVRVPVSRRTLLYCDSQW